MAKQKTKQTGKASKAKASKAKATKAQQAPLSASDKIKAGFAANKATRDAKWQSFESPKVARQNHDDEGLTAKDHAFMIFADAHARGERITRKQFAEAMPHAPSKLGAWLGVWADFLETGELRQGFSLSHAARSYVPQPKRSFVRGVQDFYDAFEVEYTYGE